MKNICQIRFDTLQESAQGIDNRKEFYAMLK